MLSNLYDTTILRRPGATLVVLLVALSFFAIQAQHFTLDASADSLLLEDDEDLRKFREIHERYPADDFLVMTFSPTDDLFDDSTLETLSKLREELLSVDSVVSAVSLLDVPLVNSSDVPLTEMVGNIQTITTPGVDRQQAKTELTTSPVYRELIISDDAKTTAMLLTLESNPELGELLKQRNALRAKKRSETGLSEPEQAQLSAISARYDEEQSALNAKRHDDIKVIRSIMDQYRSSARLHLGGVPMITDDMVSYVRSDLIVFGLGVLVFLVIVLSVIFRHPRWVLLPLLSCFYAGLVMIGLLGFMGWKVTVISSNFLALMLIITISMNIHLIVRYRQLLSDNPDESHQDLVRTTLHKMATPCFYTALTSIIGFGSLVVSGIKPVIDFGWMMSAGLLTTFVCSFTLFPCVLLLFGKPQNQLTTSKQFRFPGFLAKLTEHHGAKIVVVCLILAIGAGIGITQLRVENSFVNYFRDSTEIYRGLKLIDEKLGGTTPLEVLVTLEDTDDDFFDIEDEEGLTEEEIEFERQYQEEIANSPQYWFTPEKIDQIKRLHDYFEAMPEVGKVLSLASAIRVAETLNDDQPLDGFQLALLYTKLPADVKATLIEPYVSIPDDEARILLRIHDTQPNLRRNEFIQRITAGVPIELGLTEESVTISGLLILYNNMLQSLFDSQIATLGVVMIGIAIMFLILFRSIKLAVIGIVPNVLGALTVLGMMGWVGIPLDMMTITIAAITIGIAVDNGIHYIYRFREETARTGDYNLALHASHNSIGKAVTYTTLTIVFGFSILVLSKFIPTILFGVLTALAMMLALLAALTLLPKLILWWRPF